MHKDYSHRTRAQKLGIKQGMNICILGVRDNDLQNEIISEQADAVNLQPNLDLIFYAADSERELQELLTLREYLKADGAIWVVSLKGKAAQIKDIDVINTAKAAGLVDNKVVGFSSSHTALRLVIPRNQR